MSQVNSCLKWVFTIFNIIFAIFGGLIIVFTLSSQMFNFNGGENLKLDIFGVTVFYILGTVTMVIAVLGAHGAHKEKRGCLIAFLVCMVIGTLGTLRYGIPAAIGYAKLEGVTKEMFDHLLPLDTASDEVKKMMDDVQTTRHCCGLFNYMDWRDNIPSSCECKWGEVEEGMCQAVNYRYIWQSRNIYSKPCFPIIRDTILLYSEIGICIYFSLAALALLGTILSSIIIHQMQKSTRPTILLSIPSVFTQSPPKYQELQNPPPPYFPEHEVTHSESKVPSVVQSSGDMMVKPQA